MSGDRHPQHYACEHVALTPGSTTLRYDSSSGLEDIATECDVAQFIKSQLAGRTRSSPSAETEPGIHALRPMSDAVWSAGPLDACRSRAHDGSVGLDDHDTQDVVRWVLTFAESL